MGNPGFSKPWFKLCMFGSVNNLSSPNQSSKQSQPKTKLYRTPQGRSSVVFLVLAVWKQYRKDPAEIFFQAKRIQIRSVMFQTGSSFTGRNTGGQQRFTLQLSAETIYWSHSKSFGIMNNLHIQIHKHKAQTSPLGLQHIDKFGLWTHNKINTVCGLKAICLFVPDSDVDTRRHLHEWHS